MRESFGRLVADLNLAGAEIANRISELRDGASTHTGGHILGLYDNYREKEIIMEELVKLAGGTFTSSKIPRFELIPRRPLVRLAGRMELGLERHKEKAWNGLTPNHPAMSDKDAIIARASHAIDHASKLIAILTGQAPDDGDDHASAIMWAGTFLCESKEMEMRKDAATPPEATPQTPPR